MAKLAALDPLNLPAELQTALEALYGHYQQTYALCEEAGIRVPPVFIVVCNNTSTSKLVHDFIAGFYQTDEDGKETYQAGRLPLFRNFDEHGNRLARPRTLLIDSEQRRVGALRGVSGDAHRGLGYQHRDACAGRARLWHPVAL